MTAIDTAAVSRIAVIAIDVMSGLGPWWLFG
jgi:hypothetical protein